MLAPLALFLLEASKLLGVFFLIFPVYSLVFQNGREEEERRSSSEEG